MKILIATSTTDFDPSEVAVPWKILHDAGVEVAFATDTGQPGSADPIMLSGEGLGLLRRVLIAGKAGQDAYDLILKDAQFQHPIHFADINVADYDGLILPGGHAKGMIPYLESVDLAKAIAGFFAADKPVGAICHGVVAACRAKDPATGKSVLHGRKTTSLLNRQELLAHQLTKRKMGDYFLTYPEITVEDEVVSCLRSPDDFLAGPTPLLRDGPQHLGRGFVVRDGKYTSARWPGDAHAFGTAFLASLG